MTPSFKFTNVSAGWVDAEIRTSGESHMVDASYLTDAIRDFADALASLATIQAATCRWEQEPGELEWAFSRSGSRLEVTVSYLLGGDRKPCFECTFPYRSFCTDVLDSLYDLKNGLGLPGFKKEWGYAFPAEASSKLERAVDSDPSPETA